MIARLRTRFSGSPVWPALLSGLVAPGIGQMFNREYAKGFLLLFASIGSFIWFSRTVTRALSFVMPGTPEQWTANKAAFRDAVVKVVEQNPEMFVTFEILIILVWAFGIVDAYITARRRLRPATPDETSNP